MSEIKFKGYLIIAVVFCAYMYGLNVYAYLTKPETSVIISLVEYVHGDILAERQITFPEFAVPEIVLQPQQQIEVSPGKKQKRRVRNKVPAVVFSFPTVVEPSQSDVIPPHSTQDSPEFVKQPLCKFRNDPYRQRTYCPRKKTGH